MWWLIYQGHRLEFLNYLQGVKGGWSSPTTYIPNREIKTTTTEGGKKSILCISALRIVIVLQTVGTLIECCTAPEHYCLVNSAGHDEMPHMGYSSGSALLVLIFIHWFPAYSAKENQKILRSHIGAEPSHCPLELQRNMVDDGVLGRYPRLHWYSMMSS